MLNHQQQEPSLDLESELQQRAIDKFLLCLPEELVEPFELNSFIVYFHLIRLTQPYSVKVLILDCPDQSTHRALMRNLEKVNAAAKAVGIRYVGFGKVANVPIVFQTFFD